MLLDVLEMAPEYLTEAPSWVLKRGACISLYVFAHVSPKPGVTTKIASPSYKVSARFAPRPPDHLQDHQPSLRPLRGG